MSIIKADAIQEAATAAGLKTLREDVASALAADAEYRIREILQEALNFRRHSRRKKLTVSDMYIMSLLYFGHSCTFANIT